MSFFDNVNTKFLQTLHRNYNMYVEKVTGPAVRDLMNFPKENVKSDKKQELDDSEPVL